MSGGQTSLCLSRANVMTLPVWFSWLVTPSWGRTTWFALHCRFGSYVLLQLARDRGYAAWADPDNFWQWKVALCQPSLLSCPIHPALSASWCSVHSGPFTVSLLLGLIMPSWCQQFLVPHCLTIIGGDPADSSLQRRRQTPAAVTDSINQLFLSRISIQSGGCLNNESSADSETNALVWQDAVSSIRALLS